MIIDNLLSNLLLVVALMMACDTRMKSKDKGFLPYLAITLAFVIKLAAQPWSALGYNIWLVLFLVILIQSNAVVQNMVISFRAELGFGPFLFVIFVGLVGFSILSEMVRLLLPLAIIILLFFLISTKKSSQR